MPPLSAVDPAAWRGVAIPFPDGTTFRTAGVLAPEAAAMAESAGLVPQFITDPGTTLRSEIEAYLERTAAPQERAPLPSSPTGAYDDTHQAFPLTDRVAATGGPLPTAGPLAGAFEAYQAAAGAAPPSGAFANEAGPDPRQLNAGMVADRDLAAQKAAQAAAAGAETPVLDRFRGAMANDAAMYDRLWAPLVEPPSAFASADRELAAQKAAQAAAVGAAPPAQSGWSLTFDEPTSPAMQQYGAETGFSRRDMGNSLGRVLFPFAEHTSPSGLQQPPLPDGRMTAADRSAGVRPGAFDEDTAEPPAPQGALAADTGPGQPQGTPVAAGGGVGVPPRKPQPPAAGGAGGAPAGASAGALAGE
ncbi:MAG: hypothetical protein AB7P12_07940, partial [Alphaproteobacteria bacterium]